MIWLLAGVALLVAEMPVPGLYLMWLGLAALGTGAATLALHLPFAAEVALFAALAGVAVAVGWRLRRPLHPRTVNTPQSGLVGRIAVPLDFRGAEGRVRVGDSDWPARLVAPQALPSGAEPRVVGLRVVGVEGTTLLVAPSP